MLYFADVVATTAGSVAPARPLNALVQAGPRIAMALSLFNLF